MTTTESPAPRRETDRTNPRERRMCGQRCRQAEQCPSSSRTDQFMQRAGPGCVRCVMQACGKWCTFDETTFSWPRFYLRIEYWIRNVFEESLLQAKSWKSNFSEKEKSAILYGLLSSCLNGLNYSLKTSVLNLNDLDDLPFLIGFEQGRFHLPKLVVNKFQHDLTTFRFGFPR